MALTPTKIEGSVRNGAFRHPFSRDWTYVQTRDDTKTYVHDLTKELNGDTIASATISGKGVTLASSSNTASTVTFKVTGSDGYVEMTLGTTTGTETIRRRVRIISPSSSRIREGYIRA